MKINIVKEDQRVKTAHEEFLKQNPFFEREEKEKKKDSDLKGCFIIILSLCICMLYSTFVWIFDWHEGILALIDIILLNGWFIILFLAAFLSVLIKREKQLIGMIVLLGYGVFVFIFSFPNFYNASFDLITGETQITEGTFIMCQGRRSYGTYHIVFDGKHDMISSDRLQINDATHDMLLNAHIIRVKHWMRSGVIQSVEIISKKTSSDCI